MVFSTLTLTCWFGIDIRTQRIGAELPHGVGYIAIMWCNVKRERDVCTALVNSMVAGLSIHFSLREQMPRMLARSHFSRMALNSRMKGCIAWLAREISRAAWVNSYGAIPLSVKRQALALILANSSAPLVVYINFQELNVITEKNKYLLSYI